jgi:dTDP-4-dehydrorhamnose reductase
MRRRVIVFGGGGQLGIELVREFGRREWAVLSFDRAALDITNAESVAQAIAQNSPQLVVNAAAYNQVDAAESDPLSALQTNAIAVRNVAVACRASGADLVHYSTDYVFDGTKNGPYVETDIPHPLGAYGVSKLTGEFFAQAYLPNPLILRVSGVFGPAGQFTPRGNFVESMLRMAHENRPIRVVQDYFSTPTYAPVIASRTADLVETGTGGLFHMGGGETISFYNYAALIFEVAGLSPSLRPTSQADYRTPARRPKYSALSNGKLEAAGIEPFPPLKRALENYLQMRGTITSHRQV